MRRESMPSATPAPFLAAPAAAFAAPPPMRLPIRRLALPAFFSLAILSLARASATRVGPPLAARPAFSFALYASRRRAEFSAFRVAPAVRPTAWRPALAPLAAAFAASWPRTSASSPLSAPPDHAEETAPLAACVRRDETRPAARAPAWAALAAVVVAVVANGDPPYCSSKVVE
ncbi:hypothetical protein [Bifidobacterium adolescentis]|uniref:hypothetical protein n=1 Tax=Bifidobacterium adolescentis TaxID=1680 RepID=UPI001E51ED71|nr:hypothetical protein [Bifidobacterium adolescentis]MDB1502794.1 hypothetical protein [Bifidobacterium adolescentis]